MATSARTGPGVRKRLKRIVVGIVFWVMGRGLVSCARHDSRVRSEIATWPDGTTVTLEVMPGAPRTTVRLSGGRFEALGNNAQAEATLLVSFKNVDAVFPIVLGMRPVLQGFAEHRATVHGDLSTAMSLVRCLHIMEGYLFPDIMTRRILPRPAVREVGHLRAYAGLLGTATDIPAQGGSA